MRRAGKGEGGDVVGIFKKMMVDRIRKLTKQINARQDLWPEEMATANGPFRE